MKLILFERYLREGVISLAVYMLHLHANRYKVSPDGPRQLTLEKLQRWVNDAVALAPDDERAQAARALINENLGPYAYED